MTPSQLADAYCRAPDVATIRRLNTVFEQHESDAEYMREFGRLLDIRSVCEKDRRRFWEGDL